MMQMVIPYFYPLQEIGLTHMRISDGVGSRLQLSGLLARLCKLSSKVRKN
jgi:replication factor C subunit 2/4